MFDGLLGVLLFFWKLKLSKVFIKLIDGIWLSLLSVSGDFNSLEIWSRSTLLGRKTYYLGFMCKPPKTNKKGLTSKKTCIGRNNELYKNSMMLKFIRRFRESIVYWMQPLLQFRLGDVLYDSMIDCVR